MKKFIFLLLAMLIVLSGFTSETDDEEVSFDIESLYEYQKEFKAEEVGVCSISSVKTYEDYRGITSPSSKQYHFIRQYMYVDETTGFLYDEDGFIGAALGSYYGNIGDRYYFTLDSGVIIPIVKIDEKADEDTDGLGCYHPSDSSVIEFVIHKGYAADYFGRWGNGYILQGNYNNYSLFRGNISKVEKVLDEEVDNYVTFEKKKTEEFDNNNVFDYASGY